MFPKLLRLFIISILHFILVDVKKFIRVNMKKPSDRIFKPNLCRSCNKQTLPSRDLSISIIIILKKKIVFLTSQ